MFIMLLMAFVLTLLALPAAAQTSATDSTTVATTTVVVDELVVKARQPEMPVIPESDARMRAESYTPPEPPKLDAEASAVDRDTLAMIPSRPRSLYSMPASWTLNEPWWHGMWINTAGLSGAFVATLFVLELLPEDATAWNRAEFHNTQFGDRWYKNIFKKGPEWDHDKFIFNYVLHPYAGAAYFMCARTCGFNFWRSMLYSAIISTVGWDRPISATAWWIVG